MLDLNSARARLGREVNEAEAAVGAALVAATGLLHSAATARIQVPDVDPTLGHDMLKRLTKSVGDLITTRGDIMRVHGGLTVISEDAGILEEPKPRFTGEEDQERQVA